MLFLLHVKAAENLEVAIDELKEIATGIIGSNDADGVAKWLKYHFKEKVNPD